MASCHNHIFRQFLLGLADVRPHLALRSSGFGRDLQILCLEGIVRLAESRHGLVAAAAPSALLDAKGVNRDSAGFRRDDQVEREDAILLSALDDVAALNKDVMVRDRKSTRLNSSHLGSSYAVFC